METYQIVILVICSVLIFLYYFKQDCLEYFSATGLNSEELKAVDSLLELWKPILKPEAQLDDLKKAIINYSISKHNIQLKKMSLDKIISDDLKSSYWINDETSNYVDQSADDEMKLTNFENTITTTLENDVVNNFKSMTNFDILNLTGLNAQLDEIKKNLQFHGCLIKQKVLSSLAIDNKIPSVVAEKAWFEC